MMSIEDVNGKPPATFDRVRDCGRVREHVSVYSQFPWLRFQAVWEGFLGTLVRKVGYVRRYERFAWSSGR